MSDREKVIRAVETCFDSWIDKHRNMGLDLHEVERMKREAMEILKEREIVRCKDCKHSRRLCQPWYDLICERNHAINKPDWFCADGERR